MEVKVYECGEVRDDKLSFAVILSKEGNKWVFVRHRDRDTWEIPGGRREAGEDITDTAKRELYEETGAKSYSIKEVNDYSVSKDGTTSFGRVFYAEINSYGDMPDMEIEERRLFEDKPNKMTYPEIQSILMGLI